MYRRIVEGIPEGIWIANPQGQTIFCNQRMADILGVALESMPESCFACVFPDELATAQLYFARALEGEGKPFDFRLRRADGMPIWVSIACSMVCDEAGARIGVLGLFSDISERKLAEEELREAKGQLAAELDVRAKLHELALVSMSGASLETILDQIVDVAIKISGADFGNIQLLDPKSSDLRIVTHRGFPQWWVDFWNQVSKGQGTCGTALEQRARVIVEDVEQSPIFVGTPALEAQRQANVRAVQSTPLISQSGKLVGMFSTHHKRPHWPDEHAQRLLDLLARQAADAIERSQYQTSLRESEERFRALVNASSYVVYRMSPDWTEMRGLDGKGFIADTNAPSRTWLQAYIHPDDQPEVVETIQNAIRTKSMFRLEHRVRRVDGSLGWTLSRAVPILGVHGDILEWFGAASDITDAKKNEASLLQNQEDLRALTARLVELRESGLKELARELHDDLSQNLAALGMEISTLVAPTAERSQSLPQRIRALQQRITKLADDVHSISRRLHPAILDELGLQAALREECWNFSERTGIRVQYASEAESGWPSADVSLCIYRVAQEGLNNIAKHARAANVHVLLSSDDGTCALRIKDDGQGFDLSGAKGKNCLGLISMQERARLVNGDFTIRSEPGKGTTLELSVALKAG